MSTPALKNSMAVSSIVGGGIVGFVVGEIIGYLLRPTIPAINAQLPFGTVISRGANLKGLEQVMVPLAQTSFNYMLAGAIIGAVAGMIVGSFIGKPAQGSSEECFGCGAQIDSRVPECEKCGAATSRQRQRIALASILGTIALPLALLHILAMWWMR